MVPESEVKYSVAILDAISKVTCCKIVCDNNLFHLHT